MEGLTLAPTAPVAVAFAFENRHPKTELFMKIYSGTNPTMWESADADLFFDEENPSYPHFDKEVFMGVLRAQFAGASEEQLSQASDLYENALTSFLLREDVVAFYDSMLTLYTPSTTPAAPAPAPLSLDLGAAVAANSPEISTTTGAEGTVPAAPVGGQETANTEVEAAAPQVAATAPEPVKADAKIIKMNQPATASATGDTMPVSEVLAAAAALANATGATVVDGSEKPLSKSKQKELRRKKEAEAAAILRAELAEKKRQGQELAAEKKVEEIKANNAAAEKAPVVDTKMARAQLKLKKRTDKEAKASLAGVVPKKGRKLDPEKFLKASLAPVLCFPMISFKCGGIDVVNANTDKQLLVAHPRNMVPNKNFFNSGEKITGFTGFGPNFRYPHVNGFPAVIDTATKEVITGGHKASELTFSPEITKFYAATLMSAYEYAELKDKDSYKVVTFNNSLRKFILVPRNAEPLNFNGMIGE